MVTIEKLSNRDAATLISVIIPSYNSGTTIITCLNAIEKAAEEIPAEIIVVDSSDDETKELLEKRDDISLIRSENRLYPGEARNVGAEKASGKILCFTDADCIPDKDWLKEIVASRPHIIRAVVGGCLLNGTPTSIVGTAEYFSEFSSFLPGMSKRRVRFLPTANLAISKEDFLLVSGFRSLEKGSDVAFGRDCTERGIPIIFNPTIKVTHRNRTNLRDFLKNQERLGMGAGRTRKSFKMRGSTVARIPFLWPFVPLARFLRICARSIIYGHGQRINFLGSLPIILLGSFYYGKGFALGALESVRINIRKVASSGDRRVSQIARQGNVKANEFD